MTKVCKTINELHKTEKKSREIFKLLKPCVTRIRVYKVLKCIEETGSHLSKIKSTPKHSVKTPKMIKNSKGIQRVHQKAGSEASVSYKTM